VPLSLGVSGLCGNSGRMPSPRPRFRNPQRDRLGMSLDALIPIIPAAARRTAATGSPSSVPSSRAPESPISSPRAAGRDSQPCPILPRPIRLLSTMPTSTMAWSPLILAACFTPSIGTLSGRVFSTTCRHGEANVPFRKLHPGSLAESGPVVPQGRRGDRAAGRRRETRRGTPT